MSTPTEYQRYRISRIFSTANYYMENFFLAHLKAKYTIISNKIYLTTDFRHKGCPISCNQILEFRDDYMILTEFAKEMLLCNAKIFCLRKSLYSIINAIVLGEEEIRISFEAMYCVLISVFESHYMKQKKISYVAKPRIAIVSYFREASTKLESSSNSKFALFMKLNRCRKDAVLQKITQYLGENIEDECLLMKPSSSRIHIYSEAQKIFV